MASFSTNLRKRWDLGARICVGLDVDPNLLPAHIYNPDEGSLKAALFNYAAMIVARTKTLALAYKVSPAFFTDESLAKLIGHIHREAPGVPVILDPKWGDVTHTNRHYAYKAFKLFDADAVVLQPLPGKDALQPFLEWKHKGVIIVCRMSDESASEFSDLYVLPTQKDVKDLRLPNREVMPFYQYIAYRVSRIWNMHKNCLLVVGTTFSNEIQIVRKIVGDDMWILCPGSGAQGGNASVALQNGANSHGNGVILNVGRGIIHPDSNTRAEPRDLLERYTDIANTALSRRFMERNPAPAD